MVIKALSRFTAGCWIVMWSSAVSFGVTVADTGFEVSDQYPDPTEPDNGLGGYYDVQTLDGQDGRPMADPGEGWGTNSWAGSYGGAAYTFVERNGSAFQGDQHLVLHRRDNTIILRRKITTGLFEASRQAVLSFAVRMDTSAETPPYFAGDNAAVMFEWNGTTAHTGDKEVNIELTHNGDIVSKRGDPDGNDIVIGKWDGRDPRGLANARNNWVKIGLAADLTTQRYYVLWNGAYLGEYGFRSPLDPGQELNQIRFNCNRGLNEGEGMSVDAIELKNDFQGVVIECLSSVAPADPVSVTTWIDQTVIRNIDYTISNLGITQLSYTAAELDDSQTPAEVTWLSLSKTRGAIPAGETAVVTATVNTNGLAAGTHTAYINFSDQCNSSVSRICRIDVTIIACEWTVDSCNQVRSYLVAYSNPGTGDFRGNLADAFFRVTNKGHLPVNYVVTPEYAQTACADWITVLNSTGTLAPGQQALVTVKLVAPVLAACSGGGAISCDLHFNDTCSMEDVVRTMRVRIVGAEDAHLFKYLGNVNPQIADSGGTGIKFDIEEGVPNGTVQSMAGAQNGKAWYIDDPVGAKTKYLAYRWDNALQQYKNIGVMGEVGATIVARVKVSGLVAANDSEREGGLFIWESDSISATYHYWAEASPSPKAIEVTRGARATVPESGDWAILRMTTIGRPDDPWDCSRIVRLYLNEDPQPIIEIAGATEIGRTSGHEGFGFGAGSTNGQMQIAFDWVSGTNAGAFAPGQEKSVLGESLIPTFCPRPFADTDDDHDVDQVDFGVWQRCYSGFLANWEGEECRCFDQDYDGRITDQDFNAFAACFSGPAISADNECAD